MIRQVDENIFTRANQGDAAAQEEILNDNKGLVYLVVKKFTGRGTDFDDLVQLGMIGLYKALVNFDAELGVKFSTYAVPMIAGEIKRFLRDDGMIKVSRSVKELCVKLKYAQAELENRLSRAPKVTELADEVGVSVEDVVYALNATEPVFSLESAVDTKDSTIYLKDRVCDKKVQNEETIVDKLFLKDMLSSLKTRERQIITLRYFKEMTQQQVADLMGISQVQVCRIEKKVLKELKQQYIS